MFGVSLPTAATPLTPLCPNSVFVVTGRGYRGKRFASVLSRSLLDMQRAPIFATCREDNEHMAKILAKAGFTPVGKPYPSTEHEGKQVVLWLRS